MANPIHHKKQFVSQVAQPQKNRLAQSVMLAALAVGAAFVASKAVAQVLPNAGQISRETGAPAPSLPKPDPVLPKAQEVRPQLRTASNFSMALNGVRFSGNTQIMENDLQLLVVDNLGQRLDFNGLQAVADSVSNFYRGKGFFVARAYLPQQEIKDGIIEIAVLEGRVGAAAVKQEGTIRTNASVAQSLLNSAVPVGSIVQEKALERAALLANDLPGIDSSISLDPGAQTGDTDVTLTTTEGKPYTASLDFDNHGNRYTGKHRLGLTLNANSPLGIGDQFGLRVMHSDRDLAMVRANYSLPVGSNGARAGAAISRVVFTVIPTSGLSPSGDSTQYTLFGLYPLERQRDRSIFLNANYDHKDQRNNSGSGLIGERVIRVLSLGASMQSRDSFGGGGVGFVNFSLGIGDLDIKDANGQNQDAAGPKAAGSFAKLGMQASRIQRVNNTFSLFGGVNAQIASKNLDPAENMSLGGANGVRGYASGEATGDEGYVAQVELRADLPIEGSTQWQGFLFYDNGGIKIYKRPFIIGGLVPNSYQLNSWGLGLNISRAGSFQIRALYAKQEGKNRGAGVGGKDVEGSTRRERLWLQAVTQF